MLLARRNASPDARSTYRRPRSPARADWLQLKKTSQKIAAAKNDAAGLAIAKSYGLVNANGKLKGQRKGLTLVDGTKASVRVLGFRQEQDGARQARGHWLRVR